MQQDEINELMVNSASDAVAAVKEEFEQTLDYSLDSLALVDKSISAFVAKYPQKSLEDKTIFTISSIFGAYIGEVFKRHVGGNWRYDESDPEAPYVVLDYNNKTYAFAGICYERLVNDPTVSVKAYVDLAMANHRQ